MLGVAGGLDEGIRSPALAGRDSASQMNSYTN